MFSGINITEYPYNRKSERQAQYIPNTDLYASRKSYQTAQHLGFTLTLRNSHRNNQVLNLSSAPGYGITFNKTDFTVGNMHCESSDKKIGFEQRHIYTFYLEEKCYTHIPS